MKIDVLQHVAFEGLGAIEAWGIQHPIPFMVHKLYQNDSLPDADEVDFLIILGGPMSANSHSYAWLEKERKLIQDLIKRHKPILGICLGAQQIAKALNGNVFQGEWKEVGWHKIRKTTQRFDFIPEEMTVFHWHGEQFEVPHGAQRLFTSDACHNQGFIYQDNVIALQFHFESTQESIHALLENDEAYIDGSKYVQSAETIANYTIPAENQTILFRFLDYLIDQK